MTERGDDQLQCTLCHYWFMPAKRVPIAERKHFWNCSYCQRGVDPPQRVAEQAQQELIEDDHARWHEANAIADAEEHAELDEAERLARPTPEDLDDADLEESNR